MLKTQNIPSNFSIQIIENSSVLLPETEEKINKIWETEKAKRGEKLFNGKILSLVQVKGGILEAQVTDYRNYLAQIRDPNLFEQLNIRMLGVSGLVSYRSQVVFGKRASHLTQYPEKWELAPSGGLTPQASIEEQFFEELKEEVGLDRTMVASVHPFLLIEDTESHVIDIGMDAELSINPTDLNLAIKRKSDEYSEICWVDSEEIHQFCSLEKKRGGIVELSIELLKAKKLI